MASSSSPPLREFDVFLSFRGDDTRKTFVSHLFKELNKKGIKIFKDDKELRKGKSISPELLQAIKESKFAVVVISRNYASSGWCLDELLEIVKCAEDGSLTIFPVFYEVDPSDVKKQNGPFAESFKRYEDNPKVNPEKLQRWKKALTKVATTAGEDSRNWNDDSGLIEKIVGEISNQLVSMTSSDFSDLVGMERHMKALSDLLDIDSTNEVRMVGIWGMPGVGKTTLARYVYEAISQHFQTHYFVEDVKKFCREHGQEHGQARLQELLLSKILQGSLTVRNWQAGSNVIKARLGHQKVLIVIDDVDAIGQLRALARDNTWFGPGSRIIVTTQDKHLLVAHGVDHVYEVECLSDDEALQLFCLSAFKQKQPTEGFEQLSVRASNYAGGLPLALKVLGSFLCRRNKEEWESTFCRFDQGSLEEGITSILKVSYDGLDKQEKENFLGIACIFDGESFKEVSRVFGKIKIRTLAEKSLIVITSYGSITMHGLLKKFGRELAHGRLLTDPEEICDALTDNEANKEIEGISLDMSLIREKKLSISNGAFERMRNLKYVKVYNNWVNDEAEVNLPSSISFGDCKLKYIHWDAYPFRTFQCRLDCLVVLNMRQSKLEKLWEGSLPLRSLKKIDLDGSVNLRAIPDLSGAPNLEDIDATHCFRLVEVPSSFNSLNKLTHLKLDCCRMQRLPSIVNLKSLQVLLLGGCHGLKNFPQIPQNIRRLHVTMPEIELPDSIGNLSSLVELEIICCERLKTLPITVGNLRSLDHMEIQGCGMLESIPDTIEGLVSLKQLRVSEGRSIRKIPHLPPNLREITFTGTSIEEVPSWIGDLSKLERLDLKDNGRLKDLPASISKLEYLKYLILGDCSSLENLPVKLCESMSLLEELDLSRTGIKELPDNFFGNLTRLKRLYVGKIIRGKGLSSITNLRSLRTLEVKQDVYEPNGEPCLCPPLSSCSSLEILRLKNLNMVEIPEDICHCCPYLHELDLSGSDFHMLPASIKHLSYLYQLYLNNCKNLRSLPEVSGRIGEIQAHGCVSLESASQALHRSLEVIDLRGCIRLGQEGARSLAQRLASIAFKKRDRHLRGAWIPGSKVPRWFKDRAEGPSLKIHLPRSHFLMDVYGFATCFVVDVERPSDISTLIVDIDCDFRDNSGRSVSWDKIHQFPDLSCFDGELVIQSEHMYLSREFISEHALHLQEAFQDIHLSFNLVYGEDATLRHAKVKACGVRLLFKGDIDDHECDDIDSTDQTSDEEETESSNEKQECGGLSMPSEETEDPPNGNRPFGSEDIERQDTTELHSRMVNFFKFFCCIRDVLRVFSDLLFH